MGENVSVNSPLITPVVALVCWTLIMQLWFMTVRMCTLKSMGISLIGRRGSRPGGLDDVLPEKAQWKAHNYNHLLEQPTIFYAIVLSLALLGEGDELNLALAWAYVVLRVAHSLVQATANIIIYRFVLFIASSLVLAVLAGNAAAVVF